LDAAPRSGRDHRARLGLARQRGAGPEALIDPWAAPGLDAADRINTDAFGG
jgi:hypothetical protein